MKHTIQIKPYMMKDFYRIYGITDKTFKKWIEPFENELGEKKGRYYNIHQVKMIFDKLGMPETRDY